MVSTQPLRIQRPEALTDATFNQIRDAIVRKVLQPGQRVTESSLAEQIGVSKTPVREALVRLRHIGLLEQNGRGLRVVEPSAGRIRSVFQFRQLLEGETARMASLNEDTSGLAELHAAAAQSLANAEAYDRLAFAKSDNEFHLLVAARAGNSILERTVAEVLTLAAVLRQRDVPEGGDSIHCANHHVAIAEAIAARDPERATATMIEHVVTVAGLVSQRMDP